MNQQRTASQAPVWPVGGGAPAPADLLRRVRSRLASQGNEATPSWVAAALRAEGEVLGDKDLVAMVAALRAELAGAGPLQPLLTDPNVTDVLVNAPDEIWVDRGAGLQRVGVRFRDEAAVRALAQRLASAVGRRLDPGVPFVDARLPDGTRVHAVLPPVSPRGTVLSLRIPRRHALSLAELVDSGSLHPDGAQLLADIVAARLSFLVSGGTGAGKTSLLACLLGAVDHGERLILVEDSAELDPDHPHQIRLECRAANAEGAGAIDLALLVRQALRMRPDRIVVGEVRGGEVVDMLAALNTGHQGGCATVHANGAAEVPARIEALALAAGLDRAAAHALLGAGVQVVLHVHRGRDGGRRVESVQILQRGRDGFVVAVPAIDLLDTDRVRPVFSVLGEPGHWLLTELETRKSRVSAAVLPGAVLPGAVLPGAVLPGAVLPCEFGARV